MNDISPLKDTAAAQGTTVLDATLRFVNAHSTLTAGVVLTADILLLASCILAIAMRRATHRRVIDLGAKVSTMKVSVQRLSRLEERRMIRTLSTNSPTQQGGAERRPRVSGPLP